MAVGLLAVLALLWPAPPAAAGTVTLTKVFSVTGHVQEWVVPDGATDVSFGLVGGSGGSSGGAFFARPGGYGQTATAEFTDLSPGTTLYIGVGGAGGDVPHDPDCSGTGQDGGAGGLGADGVGGGGTGGDGGSAGLGTWT
ncbi:MAG: hypothetical protein ACRDQZ_08135, partial [Mycobacteriales bacterium]